MKLSNENIEEYILLLADHELGEAEEAEVMSFIEQHAVYQPMLNAYLATRLDPADGFVFPDKDSLLQPETNITLPLQKRNIKPLRWAAAAAILIGVLVAGSLLFSDREIKDSNDKTLASKDTIRTGPAGKLNTINPDTILLTKVMSKIHVTNVVNVRTSKVVRPSQIHFAAIAQATPKEKEMVPARLEDVALYTVPTHANADAQLIAIAEQQHGISDDNDGKSLPAWLPVNKENLQGLNDLVAHVQQLKERIEEKAQSFKKIAIVFNIGDREISIGK